MAETKAIVPSTNCNTLGTASNPWENVRAKAITTLQRSKAYSVGNTVNHSALASNLYLRCTTAGTTGSSEPTISGKTEGTSITDGSVVWEVMRTVNKYDSFEFKSNTNYLGARISNSSYASLASSKYIAFWSNDVWYNFHIGHLEASTYIKAATDIKVGSNIYKTVDNSSLTISGGTTGTDGHIALYGKSSSSYAGGIVLIPQTSSSSATLRLYPDGKAETSTNFYWNNKVVLNDNVYKKVDTSALQLNGGTDTTSSSIALYGKSSSSNSGVINLTAKNSSSTANLSLTPAKKLNIGSGVHIYKENDTEAVNVYGDTGTSRVTVFGKSCTSSGEAYKGSVLINPNNGSANKEARFYPNGDLTWEGNIQATSYVKTTGVTTLQRSKAYAVGDVAYHANLPSWAYLECTTAGTTGSTEPVISGGA